MRYFIGYLLLVLSIHLQAQDAPDFEVTDSGGHVHHLYSDYLDQGKTVVLKLFFIECPPCSAIAPLFDDLYADWGSGNDDVVFMALSTTVNPYNNNSGVAQYLIDHNLSYIGVGNDGGSLEATSPYRMGMFGPYQGTPTFVIIAPNKSVQYKPPGSGQTLINNVNQAIINTGAMMTSPQTSFVIDADYANGLYVPDSIFLQNGDGTNKVLLSSNSFSLPDETLYPGLVDPHLILKKNAPAYVGLDIVDIIKLRKHILKIDKFQDPLSFLAADLDDSDVIGVGDLVVLQKVILKIYAELPNGLPMYRYISTSCETSDPYCLNGIPLSLNPGNTEHVSIQSLKMGDLSVIE